MVPLMLKVLSKGVAAGVPVSPVFPDTAPASCSLWAALTW